MTHDTVRYPAAAPRKNKLELQDVQCLGTPKHPLVAYDDLTVIFRHYYVL
jgi:hypothetical protein